jgi:hypothetical protein
MLQSRLRWLREIRPAHDESLLTPTLTFSNGSSERSCLIDRHALISAIQGQAGAGNHLNRCEKSIPVSRAPLHLIPYSYDSLLRCTLPLPNIIALAQNCIHETTKITTCISPQNPRTDEPLPFISRTKSRDSCCHGPLHDHTPPSPFYIRP